MARVNRPSRTKKKKKKKEKKRERERKGTTELQLVFTRLR
jgi:hypothetical protein